MLENTLSPHRPAWTQDDLHAYKHLHLPVRHNGKVVAPINRDHFVRTQGFASRRDLDLTNPAQPLQRQLKKNGNGNKNF